MNHLPEEFLHPANDTWVKKMWQQFICIHSTSQSLVLTSLQAWVGLDTIPQWLLPILAAITVSFRVSLCPISQWVLINCPPVDLWAIRSRWYHHYRKRPCNHEKRSDCFPVVKSMSISQFQIKSLVWSFISELRIIPAGLKIKNTIINFYWLSSMQIFF